MSVQVEGRAARIVQRQKSRRIMITTKLEVFDKMKRDTETAVGTSQEML